MAERRTGVSRAEAQAAGTLIRNIGLNQDAATISGLSLRQLEHVKEGTAQLTRDQHNALAAVRQNQQSIRQLYDHNLDRPRGEKASKPGQAIKMWLDQGKTRSEPMNFKKQGLAIKALGALGRDPDSQRFYVRRGSAVPA
jgi:hypothetical protein